MVWGWDEIHLAVRASYRQFEGRKTGDWFRRSRQILLEFNGRSLVLIAGVTVRDKFFAGVTLGATREAFLVLTNIFVLTAGEFAHSGKLKASFCTQTRAPNSSIVLPWERGSSAP